MRYFLYFFTSIFFFSVRIYAIHQVIDKDFQGKTLYKETKPFSEGYLRVSETHSIYYAQFGNPDGIPVIALHGGPGSRCHASWTQLFDPDFFHVVMFDQRGAGRSTPFAEMVENSPQHSVKDIEAIREHLSIDQWVVFGGSYGSFLSILYGETHPERCLGFVLRGIFTGTEHEYMHLFHGMRHYYPEVWDEIISVIPKHERDNILEAFYCRVMDHNPEVHMPAAKAFMRLDSFCATLLPNQGMLDAVENNRNSTLGIARAFIHYAANGFFIEENQLLDNLDRISHLPAIIVHGRYDLICPPQNAFNLFKEWPHAELWYITGNGHSSNEPGIKEGLLDAVEAMKERIE